MDEGRERDAQAGRKEAPRILVGIASYRDPELLKTILSAIRNARYKDRLVFAVVNQFDDATKHDFDYFSFPNLKLVQLDYRLSAGVGFARRLMTDLLDDEDFCLQIDSHMRFEPDWDEILLQEWRACEDERAVLSVHPMGYTYEESGAEILQPDTQVGKMRVEKFNKVIPVFYGERYKPKGDKLDKPEPTLGLAGGLVFGSRESFVPYIHEVCFMGEEFVRAFQLFSFGFNLYTPRRVPLRHLYKRAATRFWNDMPAIGEKDKYNKMTADSYKFIRQLLAGSLQDYSRHFGNVRSLQEYEKYLGLPILLETEHSTPEPENLKPGAEQKTTLGAWHPASLSDEPFNAGFETPETL